MLTLCGIFLAGVRSYCVITEKTYHYPLFLDAYESLAPALVSPLVGSLVSWSLFQISTVSESVDRHRASIEHGTSHTF